MRHGITHLATRLGWVVLLPCLLLMACSGGVAGNIPLAVDEEIGASDSCDPAVARDRVRAASLRVRATFSQGTAFHIGDGRYVTAHHVVEDSVSVEMFSGFDSFPARVVYVEPAIDLAIIESSVAIPNGLAFASEVEDGDSGWSFGFSRRAGVPREFRVMPEEDWPSVHEVLADDLGLGHDDILLFEGVADPGDSGSAVVSDCGEVLAVLTGGFNPYFAHDHVVLGISQMAAQRAAIAAFD